MHQPQRRRVRENASESDVRGISVSRIESATNSFDARQIRSKTIKTKSIATRNALSYGTSMEDKGWTHTLIT